MCWEMHVHMCVYTCGDGRQSRCGSSGPIHFAPWNKFYHWSRPAKQPRLPSLSPESSCPCLPALGLQAHTVTVASSLAAQVSHSPPHAYTWFTDWTTSPAKAILRKNNKVGRIGLMSRFIIQLGQSSLCTHRGIRRQNRVTETPKQTNTDRSKGFLNCKSNSGEENLFPPPQTILKQYDIKISTFNLCIIHFIQNWLSVDHRLKYKRQVQGWGHLLHKPDALNLDPQKAHKSWSRAWVWNPRAPVWK